MDTKEMIVEALEQGSEPEAGPAKAVVKSNEGGTKKAAAKKGLKEPAKEDKQKPYFVQELPEKHWVRAGEPLQLKCIITGIPVPSVDWLNNNTKLQNSK